MRYVLSPQFDIYETISHVVRGRVCDIGFGTGFGTHLFLINASVVYGYEIDEDAVRFAERVFPMPKICFRHGNIENGIEDDPYDFIIMIDVIEHLERDKQAILNVKKLMAKNGSFILSTPNRLSRYRKSEDHIKEYGYKDLESLLKMAFVSVNMRNHKLEPLTSKYENPLVAICRNEA